MNSKHRKPFYANKLYFCYFCCMLVYSMLMLTYKLGDISFFKNTVVYLGDKNDYSKENLGEINRLVTLAGILTNTVLSLLYENFINKVF